MREPFHIRGGTGPGYGPSGTKTTANRRAAVGVGRPGGRVIRGKRPLMPVLAAARPAIRNPFVVELSPRILRLRLLPRRGGRDTV